MSEPTQVRRRPTVYTWGALIVGLPVGLLMMVVLLLFAGALSGVGTGEIVRVGEYANAEPAPWVIKALALSGVLLLWFVMWRSLFLALFVRYARGSIDERNRLVVLRPMIGKSRTIRFDSVAGFSACSIPSWLYSGGSGIALYLKDGGHIQLNELSMNGIRPLRKALSQSGVSKMGTERCWFYPFAKRKYKFDPK